ncbi:Kanadaptin [Oopsacas minuta]|uniref:Kanadaptin n=1 Tax=Oopsacas minuta TaxID=111878 RepID=A0AAV7JJ07_9METZ|nr:Kanadaptin [Oopsacas minuta]
MNSFFKGSTHGCKINKNRIPQRTFVRVRTGHLIKFGESTRLYILESNDGYQAEVELEADREIEDFTKQKLEKEQNEEFISWGIELDSATGTKELTTDGEKEEFYKKDPKKYLKDFFEREGLEMRFDSDQLACGKNRIGFTVKLQLPLEDGNGCPLYADVTVEGKKRDAIRACALEACRMLDTSGILRETRYVSSRKRKSAVRAENDYYSSDEDSFLDRTGDLENKREKRLLKSRKTSGEIENYSSLHTKLLAIQSEINEMEFLIQNTEAKNTQKASENQDLEEFMKELNSKNNTKSVSKLKYKLSQLRSEEGRISKLESIAKPVEILGKPISVIEPSPNIDGYGLKLPPDNRKQEYLKKTTVIVVDPETQTSENSENQIIEKKKVYSVELPPHLKGTFTTETDTQQQQQQHNEDVWEEAEYIDWLPPSNQSGDGTSKLNDEFGY